MQSKNAIGNLINKYKAVLKKCTLINTFGSLALAGMFLTGLGTGVDVSCARSLNDVSSGGFIYEVDEIVTSGTLTGTVIATFAGVTGNATVTGYNTSAGYATQLTLTGLGSTNGELATGNVTVSDAAVLTLGQNTPPQNATIGGKLLVSGAIQLGQGNPRYTQASIKGIGLTVSGGVEVEKSGRLDISDGATLNAETLNINYNGGGSNIEATPNVYVGAYGDNGSGKGTLNITGASGLTLNDGHMYVGDGIVNVAKITGTGSRPGLLIGSISSANHRGTVNVSGTDGIHFSGTGGTLWISNGTLEAEKVVLTSGARFSIGDERYTYANGIANITGDGIFLSNSSYLDAYHGTVNTTDLQISNESYVRVGIESSQGTVNISNAKTYTASTFAKQTYYMDGSSIANHRLYNTITIGENGVFNIDNALTLSTSGGNTLETVGVLSADSVTVANNASLLINGGTLLSRGDIHAGGITLGSGFAENISTGVIKTVDNAGVLQLAGTGTNHLQSSVTVNGTNASLYITNGHWIAHEAIQVQNGSLVVSGGNLDASGTSLSISTSGQGDISGGTLTAQLSNFGTIDLSKVTGSQFSETGASVQTNLLGNAVTSLILSGFDSTGIYLTTDQYFSLLDELHNKIFGVGSEVSALSIEIEGLNIPVESLSKIIANTHAPVDFIGSGDITTNIDVTYGNIITSGTSTLSAGSLTLTGLGQGGSTLAVDDIIVNGGALTLGYSGAEGTSPTNTSMGGALTATGASSTVAIEHTHVTVNGGVDLENGADLTIATNAGLTSNKILVDGATLNAQGEVHSTGEEGIIASNGAVLTLNGTTSSTTLVADDSTVNVGGALSVNGALETKNGAALTITGSATANATNIDNSALTVGDGVLASNLTTNTLNTSNNGTLTIKNAATAHFLGDYTAAPSAFSTHTQANSIAVQEGGTFLVDGALSFDTSTDNTLTTGGTVAAKSISIGENSLDIVSGTLEARGGSISGADMTLLGGHLSLVHGTSASQLQSAVTINNAASSMHVQSGTWTSEKNITVHAGSLVVDAQSSLITTGAVTIHGGSLQVGGALNAQGGLTISGGTADISSGSLTARLEDFGSVDFTASSGAQFSTVSGTGVEVDLTTNVNSAIVLTGYGASTVLSPSEYNALLSEILQDITIDSSASLSIEGISFDPTLFTLSDVAINMTEPQRLIKAGDLQQGALATFAGIETHNNSSDIHISHENAVLTLTGAGTTQGILTHGNVDISAGTFAMGLAGTSPNEITVQGYVYANGDKSTVMVNAGQTTIQGGVTVENTAELDVALGTTLITPKLTVDAATAHINGALQGNIDVKNGANLTLAGQVTSSAIMADAAHIELNNATAQLQSSGTEGIQLRNASTLTVNQGQVISERMDLQGSTLTVGSDGHVTLSEYTFTNSDIDIAGNISLTGDRTLSADDFGTGKDAFDLTSTGVLSVQGALTLDAATAQILQTQGTVRAQDIAIIGGDISLKSGSLQSLGGSITGANINIDGGNLALTQGDGAAQLGTAVNITGGEMQVQGGTWTAEQAITVNGGAFSIDGASLHSSDMNIGASGTLNIARGELNTQGNTLEVAGTVNLQDGGTLTADLADFGSISGTTFTAGGSVAAKLNSETGSNLVLGGASGSYSLATYGTLIDNAKGEIFATTNGALTFDGVSIDTSNNSLTDITTKNMGLSLDKQFIGAGTLDASGALVTFSHIVPNGDQTDAIVDSGTLVLTGSAAAGRVTEGNIVTTDTAGSVFIGSNTAQTPTETFVGGSIIANKGSVAVQNTHTTIEKDVTAHTGGKVTVASGAGVSVQGETRIGSTSSVGELFVENEAFYRATSLVLQSGSTVHVGQADVLSTTGGSFSAQSVVLNDGMIYLDPAWQDGATIANASSGAIASFTNGIDGDLVMGQHSFMVLGESSTQWAQEAFARSGLTWGPNDISAALFVRSPQILDYTSGSLLVNGALTSAPMGSAGLVGGTLGFAKNSLLLVDAQNLDDETAALTVTGAPDFTGTLAVAPTAKLYIENGRNGDVAIVANVALGDISDGNGGNIAAAAWLQDNVGSTSALVDVTNAWYDSALQSYMVTLKQTSAASEFPLLDPSMALVVDNLLARGPGLDVDSSHAGVRFISRATDNRYIGTTDTKLAAATIEGGAQVAAIGAVPQSTLNTSQAMTITILQRTSLAHPVANRMAATDGGKEHSEKDTHGLGLWVMPLYQSSMADDFEGGNFSTGYTSELSGLAIGGDITLNDIFRIGMGFGLGAGQSTSSGDFNETTNSFDFWALSLYGALQHKNFGLTVDVGYSVNENQLNQKLPQSMAMSDLKTDVTSSAWTMGLRAEYVWKTPYVDITPHVGMRYTVLNTGAHDVESNGAVYNVAASNQSILTVPVGLTLSKNIQTESGWEFTPRMDVGFLYATGDLEARTQASIPSVVGTTDLTLRTLDEYAITAGLGLEAKKGDFSLGVNYNTQMSEHKTDHMLFGFVRYEFGGSNENEQEKKNNDGINSGSLLPETLAMPEGQATKTAGEGALLPETLTMPESQAAKADSTPLLAGGAGTAETGTGDKANLQVPQLSEKAGNVPAGSAATSTPSLLGASLGGGNDGDVHLLAPIEVRGIEIGSGSYGIRGDVLRSLPNATGTVTGALKSMSNVQFSNAEQSSQQGGEIAPPRISIYGSKPYENNFLVDGMSVSNTLNPSGFEGSSSGNHVGGPNYLVPGGGDQDIFYDTQLLEEINIYTNNVPAKYGNFTGGVIDATLRDPKRDKWHFRFTGKTTSSSWYEVRDADEDSTTAASQPKYDIYNVSAMAEGPITDTLSVLLGYTNTHSFIPLKFEDTDGSISEKNQYRLSQNFFGKLVFTPTKDLTFRVDASYAPYEDLRWREGWPESEQTLFNEAIRVAFQTEYKSDIGDFDFKVSYLKSGYSTEAQSSFIEQDLDNGISRGGYGSRTVDKTEFVTSLDYTSPLKKHGWLTWKFESGISLNITGVNMWAEETSTDIMVRDLGSGSNMYDQRTLAFYDETNQYNTMTKLGFYAQAEFKVDRITFTPGFRIDTDNLTNNVDISPRLKLEIDVFDNKMLRLVAGYNRYYGSALREYAFNRYRQFENTQIRTYHDGREETIFTLGASRQYDIAGLETPYSDEYTVGLLGTVWGVDYSLDYTVREHRNQLISEEIGEQLVIFDGKSHTQSVYELTNKGFSTYEGITLTLGRSFDLNKWGKHYVGFGATVARSKTFEGSYDDDTTLDSSNGFPYESGMVYYNGSLINRADMPASDYNAPLTLTLNIQSSFFEDRLRINWLNRWKADSQGIMHDEQYSDNTPHGTTSGSNTEESYEWITENGSYVLAYREGTIKGGLISDVNIEYDVIKEEDFLLGVSLDVYNIFNADVGVSASDPGVSSKGTSFWLGVYAEF